MTPNVRRQALGALQEAHIVRAGKKAAAAPPPRAILRSGAAREDIKYKWQNETKIMIIYHFAYSRNRSLCSRRKSLSTRGTEVHLRDAARWLTVANGHLSSCGLPPLLAWILLAGEQAQLELAFNEVLIGHAAAPLAWRGHQRRQGDWRPQLTAVSKICGPQAFCARVAAG